MPWARLRLGPGTFFPGPWAVFPAEALSKKERDRELRTSMNVSGFFWFCGLFFGFSAWAQQAFEETALDRGGVETPAPILRPDASLPDYLAYLEHFNPALKQLQHERAALHKDAEWQGGLPDPHLSLALFAEQVETRVGPQEQKLGLKQPWLPKSKRKLKAALPEAAAAVVDERLEALKALLMRQFKNEYAEYYYLGKSVETLTENLELLRSLESVIDTKYRTGSASYSSYIRLQIEIDQNEDRLQAAKAQLFPFGPRLNALLGRAPDAAIPVPRSMPLAWGGWPGWTQQEVADRLQRHPQLRVRDREMAVQQTQMALAKSQRRPLWDFGVEWIRTGPPLVEGVPGAGKDPVIFSVGLNLPVWKKNYSARERAAGDRYAAVEAARLDDYGDLQSQFHQMLYHFRDASRRIELYRDNLIPKSHEALQVTLKSFETNHVSYLDVIEVNRGQFEFQLSFHRALADKAKAVADLEWILSDRFPRLQEEVGHGNRH